jgi:phosphoribosylamine--glycine ligase
MKVLVVGNGAREHAIAKKLAQEDLELVAAMSRLNPGIAALSERVEVFDINDPAEYGRFRDVDLAFVGPEAPLAMGVSDRLWELGVPVVGARKALARLEWSKAYTRQVVQEHGISGNPEFAICRSAEEVDAFLKDHEEVAVKPDVLTGGKGVRVTGDHLNSAEETRGYALEQVKQDGLVVIEEKLKGREFTLQAFTTGTEDPTPGAWVASAAPTMGCRICRWRPWKKGSRSWRGRWKPCPGAWASTRVCCTAAS